MESASELLKQYLIPGRHVHLVGIGGVSMRPLGLVLKDMGLVVTGSDMNASVSTDELIAKDIPVSIGHREENIAGADCLIRTAAAHNDNPEISAARSAGIPVFERAQAWGVIMQSYKNAICIAGTHGKTTTSSMVTHILMQAKMDPTVMIGGNLPLLHAGHRVGRSDTIILESCEYCDSFLNFFPSLAVILNIEEDHLDYFKDLADIQKSFRKFARLSSGCVLANGDDPHTVQALDGLDYVNFGLQEHNRIRAINISADWRNFDVLCDEKPYCHIDLNVLGKHNLKNALAAAGTAWILGVPGIDVTAGLSTFRGADRRLQYKGSYNGAEVYDDYAHHPDEVASTLEAVRLMGKKRVILAFQPHTYTRTKALFSRFVEELQKADILVLAEIYAARERDDGIVCSADLQKNISGSILCATLPELTEYLRGIARDGDLILTMGAGDIYRVSDALCGLN